MEFIFILGKAYALGHPAFRVACDKFMQKKEVFFSWEAPEFRYYEKNFGWYVTLGSIVVLLAGYMAVSRDYFGAVSFAILGGLVFFFSMMKPRTVIVELSDKGVHLDNLHIPYKQIQHFWVVHNDRHQTLNLHTQALLQRLVIIQLEDQDPDEIREFLLAILPEHDEADEVISQAIAHKLKF